MITITIPKNDVIDFLKSRNYTNEAALLEYIQSFDFCQMAIGVIRSEKEKHNAVGTMAALMDIRQTICTALKLNEEDLSSKSRKRAKADARKIYSYLAWKYTVASFEVIGKTMNRHYSSVINAKDECMAINDKGFISDVKYIEEQIGIQYTPVDRKNSEVYNLFRSIGRSQKI